MSVGVVVAACVIGYAAAMLAFLAGYGWLAAFGVLVVTGVASVFLIAIARLLGRRLRGWQHVAHPRNGETRDPHDTAREPR